MRSLKSWFEKTFPPEEPQQQRAERRAVPGLEAIHWTGSSPGLDIVRNISATGMYLVTRERWPQGEVNPIRLVYPELNDDSPDRQVTLETKAVRWGEDGMGLTFVLPDSMDLWLWKTDGLIEPPDILSEFRLARALAFLRRICPSATQELKLLFREGLSNLRIASAISIAHRAEAMLAAERDFDRLRAPQNVVMRVIKEGSWAEDSITQQLWAGILATACTLMGDDESNLPYIDLLAELASIDGRLFTTACTRSQKVFASYRRGFSRTAHLLRAGADSDRRRSRSDEDRSQYLSARQPRPARAEDQVEVFQFRPGSESHADCPGTRIVCPLPGAPWCTARLLRRAPGKQRTALKGGVSSADLSPALKLLPSRAVPL